MKHNVLSNNPNINNRLFVFKNHDASAKYKGKSFVVLKGSAISLSEARTCPPNVQSVRYDLDTMLDSENRLTQDVSFSSPSAAGAFVSGGSCNGLVYWIDKKTKKSMKELLSQDESD